MRIQSGQRNKYPGWDLFRYREDLVTLPRARLQVKHAKTFLLLTKDGSLNQFELRLIVMMSFEETACNECEYLLQGRL
jgi:hypothetical protein